MKRTGYAFFVRHPRTIEDLMQLHDVRLEKPFQIAKTVSLGVIDYENFIMDMLIDRPYIEKFSPLCGNPGDCLYIKQRGLHRGVLVIPRDGSFVSAAAWVVEIEE